MAIEATCPHDRLRLCPPCAEDQRRAARAVEDRRAREREEERRRGEADMDAIMSAAICAMTVFD